MMQQARGVSTKQRPLYKLRETGIVTKPCRADAANPEAAPMSLGMVTTVVHGLLPEGPAVVDEAILWGQAGSTPASI